MPGHRLLPSLTDKQGSMKPQLFLEAFLDLQNENLLEIKTNIQEVQWRQQKYRYSLMNSVSPNEFYLAPGLQLDEPVNFLF